MKTIKFDGVLLKNGWLAPAYLTIDSDYKIQNISAEPNDSAVDAKGYLIPGFQNAHSHAFQYAFAGLTENLRSESCDNFWSWRKEMYKLALTITPDSLMEIATRLYKECVELGYTSIAEFHYLHHDIDGKPYADPAQMSLCLMEAAKQANIELTLIPIFYQKSNFAKEANEDQRRFICKTVDDYFKLVELVEKHANNYENVNHAIGIHSLRAVSDKDIIQSFQQAPADLPKHIHIAEQQREVKDCLEFYGKRPLEWLLENVEVDSNYHLVHATHINESELKAIIKAQANVVLCPSTEANLGDGIFPFTQFCNSGGQWSIGTDSHIGLSPMEELRWLEYTQRLNTQTRNPLCKEPGDDSGTILFHQAQIAGRRAMGRKDKDYFEVGKGLRGIVLEKDAPVMTGKPLDKILSTLIFAGDRSVIR